MPALSFQRRQRRFLFPILVYRQRADDMTSFAATALLDTGATASGIGPSVVDALDLRSHMKKRLLSATEEVFADYFLFRIGLYSTGQIERLADGAQEWPYIFDAVEGFGWRRPADFDVIVGMDILGQCDLSLQRNGTCELRFG